MVESDALRLVFVAGMAAAGAWDLRTQRIPNALTLPLALAGLAAALWERGWPGAGWSVLGVLAPLLLLAFPLAAGWIGGGDVKLLMAAGAWLGPWGALGVSLLGSAFGGVAAACYVLWCAGRDGWLAMAVGHTSGFVQHVRRHYGRRTLAYGPALAVAGVLWLYGGIALWRLWSRLGRVRRDERGQALVEMALVLPILLVLVFTLLAGGSLMLRYYAVTVAAREGARAAALGESAPETRIRDVMTNYDLDPGKPGTVISVYDCHGGNYKCARVRYVADTIVPGYVFGGTAEGLPLESVAAFRKEGP